MPVYSARLSLVNEAQPQDEIFHRPVSQRLTALPVRQSRPIACSRYLQIKNDTCRDLEFAASRVPTI